MTRDEETLRVYAARADDYARNAAGSDEDPLLDAFMGNLPAGGTVLDLGCGPGLAAARMAEAGFTVDATDAAPEMVAMAARHDGVTARLAGFDDIDGTDLYDGIWANFSLLHATRGDMPRHLAALRRALRPGGHLHIALKSGIGEARDTLGRFYTYYTEEELRGLLRDAGFTPVSCRTGTGEGLDGTIAPWIAMTAHG